MTRKQKIGLLVILVLVSAVLVKKYAHFSWLPSLDSWEGDLDEIRIDSPDSNFTLKSIDGKWYVGEKNPADKNQLENISNELRELAIISEVSDQKDYERYELNDGRAVHIVALKSGETVRDLYVGKNSPVGQQSYVRLAGKDEVFLVGGQLRDLFSKDQGSFRSKDVLSVPVDEISKIEVKYQGQSFTLVADADVAKSASTDENSDNNGSQPLAERVWKLDGQDLELDQNKVREYVSGLNGIIAGGFAKDGVDAGAVQCSIIVTSKGTPYTLELLGKMDDGSYYCRSSELPYIVFLGAWRAEKLMKSVNDLKK